jgi:hypothetical protein
MMSQEQNDLITRTGPKECVAMVNQRREIDRDIMIPSAACKTGTLTESGPGSGHDFAGHRREPGCSRRCSNP